MANKEQQPAPVATDENGGRRTFMKGIVAGSIAAGTLASTVTNAAPAQFAAPAAALVYAKARPETAKLRVSFDQQRLPKLSEVQDALASILRRSGCPNCGLGGIDVLLRLDQIINPQDRFIAVVEGEIFQG